MNPLKLRPFKADWEKTSERIVLPDQLIEEMINSVLSGKKIQSYQVINGGCANINIELNCNDGNKKILRIYLRDSNAAYREKNIARLIQSKIPAPRVEQIGVIDNYQFTISDFKQGITLRDLLLSKQDFNIDDIMSQIGLLLAKLAHFNFSKVGFFDRNLNVTKVASNDECIQFAKEYLQKQNATIVLSNKVRTAINANFDRYCSLIERMKNSQLVHGDFDPACKHFDG